MLFKPSVVKCSTLKTRVACGCHVKKALPVRSRQTGLLLFAPALQTLADMLRTVFCALLLVLFTHSAEAWNGVGHRIIAEMVWRGLTKANVGGRSRTC